jgi:hypothetical protein
MSASDLVTVVVAGVILYIAYKVSGTPAGTPAAAPTGPVRQQSQQPRQVVYVQNPNQPLQAQLAPQIVYVQTPAATPTNNTSQAQQTFNEQEYNEYLQAAMAIGQIPKESIPGQGPSWLGCI